MSDQTLPTPTTIGDLAREIDTRLKEPQALYNEGLAELVAKFGSEADIPMEVRSRNEKMGQGYSRAAEVLSEVAQLAFNYAAREMGVTGFQGSWAALHTYGELMGIKGPFRIIEAKDAAYPQYDGRIERWYRGQDVKDFMVQMAQDWLTNTTVTKGKVHDRMTLIATNYEGWVPNP